MHELLKPALALGGRHGPALVLLVCATVAAPRAQANPAPGVEVAPAPTTAQPRHAGGLGADGEVGWVGPGEAPLPQGTALRLRGARVANAGGADLRFADLEGDVQLRGPDHANGPVHLRLALQGVRSTVARDGRAFTGLGNLRLSAWVEGARRQGLRVAARFGLALPVGHLAGLGGRVYEQRTEVTVPSLGLWTGVTVATRTRYWHLSADAMLGFHLAWLGDSSLMSSATLTAAFRLHRTLSLPIALVVPGQWIDFRPTLLCGARWRPARWLEVSAGVHLVLPVLLGDVDGEEESLLRPTADLRVWF